MASRNGRSPTRFTSNRPRALRSILRNSTNSLGSNKERSSNDNREACSAKVKRSVSFSGALQCRWQDSSGDSTALPNASWGPRKPVRMADTDEKTANSDWERWEAAAKMLRRQQPPAIPVREYCEDEKPDGPCQLGQRMAEHKRKPASLKGGRRLESVLRMMTPDRSDRELTRKTALSA